MGDVEINTKGLDNILKALKVSQPSAKVGILGDKNARTKNKKSLTLKEVNNLTSPIRGGGGEHPNNPTIGAWHEFGTSTLPQRSFLRVPLTDRLSKEIDSSGALDKDVLNDVIKSGTVIPWLTKIAIIAQNVVLGAFDSGGYGKWPAWSPGYSNNTGQILVNTTQLRNSISYEVKA